jgi:predicted MFS family arabinose efflux permease
MGTLQLVGGAGALAGAALYAVLCRFVPLRVSLAAGILLNAASTFLFVFYDSRLAALLIHGGGAVVGTVAMLPLYDLAARATPKGSESLGFALIMSVYTLASFALSDPLGSYLYGHLHLAFKTLVCVNALWTLAVLLFLPAVPRALTATREGRSQSA